jgi:hypothetical protein
MRSSFALKMKHTLIPLLLALSTFCSCCLASDKTNDKKHLRAEALYNDKEHAKKCLAAFDALRKELKVGMTSSKASQVLGDAKWLKEIHGYEFTILAGWIPVDLSPERAFAIHLYPNADNWSNYVVYFSLSVPVGDRTAFTIKDFLMGKVKDDNVKIHQFALCHPGKATNEVGHIEVIPKTK